MRLAKIFIGAAIFLPILSFADNSFIISTDVQSIPVGVMSSKINVQSASPVTETTYLVFTSSSATGQFLNSSGNPQTSSVYISTGDSNRGLYYKDSTAGDFVISVAVQNKSKVQIASLSQHIFVGQSLSNASATTTTETATTTTSVSTSDVEIPNTNVTSAHSSPAPLSNSDEKLEFEIFAGRDRLAMAGSSLVFRAVLTKSDKITESGITWQWSFGDGTVGTGNNISHVYKFAGDYAVVVNASYTDRQAVSRTQVRVVSPNISLARVSGGVEVTNKSGVEINLEGWSLIGNKKTFVFPKDTLVSLNKKVIFADEVTGMSEYDTQLLNPIGKEFASFVLQTPTIATAQVATTTRISLDDIQVKLNDAKNKLIQMYPSIQTKQQVAKVTIPNPSSVLGPTLAISNPTSTTTQDTRVNTATVFQAEKQTGFVSSIFSWPIKGFGFIKRLFVED